MTADPVSIRPLVERLIEAQVGGCNCDTKTPVIQHHSPTCHYRLHFECMVLLEMSVQYECRQCGSRNTMPVVETP